MKLRDLELKDAPLMLEWMHDNEVVEKLRGRFQEKTIEDAENFIRAAKDKKHNIHLAICSDDDEYMGTVSLKSIQNRRAEFAITVRRIAMGKGYSWWGMRNIIKLAFEQYGLDSVYWCVARENIRAVRFYDKHNFRETLDIPDNILSSYKNIPDLKWYSVLTGELID